MASVDLSTVSQEVIVLLSAPCETIMRGYAAAGDSEAVEVVFFIARHAARPSFKGPFERSLNGLLACFIHMKTAHDACMNAASNICMNTASYVCMNTNI